MLPQLELLPVGGSTLLTDGHATFLARKPDYYIDLIFIDEEYGNPVVLSLTIMLGLKKDAIQGKRHTSNASDFVVENGVLKKYSGVGGDVVIPKGVTEIGVDAFVGCKKLPVQAPAGNYAETYARENDIPFTAE